MAKKEFSSFACDAYQDLREALLQVADRFDVRITDSEAYWDSDYVLGILESRENADEDESDRRVKELAASAIQGLGTFIVSAIMEGEPNGAVSIL